MIALRKLKSANEVRVVRCLHQLNQRFDVPFSNIEHRALNVEFTLSSPFRNSLLDIRVSANHTLGKIKFDGVAVYV